MTGDQNSLATTSRAVAFVPSTTAVSQEYGTGSVFSSLEAHFAGTEILSQYPNISALVLAIMDDFHVIAALKYLGPIFTTSKLFSSTALE